MKKTKYIKSNSNEISFWKKIWILLDRKDKISLIGIFILQFVGSLVEVVGLSAIPAFILVLANPGKLLANQMIGPILLNLNITNSESLLIWGSIFLIITFAFKNLYLIWAGYVRSNYLRGLQIRYGMNLFETYMYADYTYLLSHNTAELLRNCITEVSQVTNGIIQGILTLFMDALLIINISVVLFILEPIITLLTVLSIGSVAFMFLRFSRGKLENLGKRAQQARRGMVLSVNQGLHGIKETRIMHAEQFFISEYEKSIKQMARSAKLLALVSSSIKPIFETLAVAALLLITLIMFLQNRSIESVIPILSAFGIGMVRLLPAIREMTTTISNLRFSFYSVNPIYESMFIPNDALSIKRNKDDFESKIKFEKEIELKDISYTYANSSIPAVNEVSLKIRKGEVIALVGSSGAGKTTLADIMTGLLLPTNGKIYVDGKDITNQMRKWQNNLGYIPQFIYLADNTLKNNILWGRRPGKNNKIQLFQTIEAAKLEELVEQLPLGVNTIIGEKGTRLSGGQRQRVGIARAIYGDPDVLIMDEATAALDNITEKEITDAINEMKGDKTMIVIAHRLSTVRSSDRLYLMDEGRIVTSGSYDDLLNNSPEFKALHDAMEKS